MKYHRPDERWSFFGCNNFEVYLQKFVYTGKFNRVVPKEIIENYEVIEYLMAHAYYFYPLYDEAVAKSLMLLETCIKTRCEQLSISLTLEKKRGNGTVKNVLKNYNRLIDDYAKAEPIKNVKDELHNLRKTRNNSIHKARYSYAGPILATLIIRCINLINVLFISESALTLMNKKVKSLKQEFRKLSKGSLVIKYRDEKYLLEKITIEEGALLESGWRFFIVCYPIIPNVEEQIKNNSYSEPFYFEAKELHINENSITFIDCDSSKQISILLSHKSQDKLTIKHFFDKKKSCSKEDLLTYVAFREINISKKSNEFKYRNLCDVISDKVQ